MWEINLGGECEQSTWVGNVGNDTGKRWHRFSCDCAGTATADVWLDAVASSVTGERRCWSENCAKLG